MGNHYIIFPRKPPNTMNSTNKNMAPSLRQTFNGQGVLRICGKTKIGTWNVRSLHQAGKLQNVIKEMKEYEIDILGISEVRWTDSGCVKSGDHTMWYSGGSNHKNGVGIILHNKIAKMVEGYIALSDRIIITKLNTKPFKINIMQVYAPTTDTSDEEIEIFYEEIEEALSTTKSQEINIILGDFNAKVGKGKESNVVGSFGLGRRNQRGERLIEFCVKHNLVIANTWSDQPERRLYTWKAPGDTTSKIIRNQIDYILINQRFKNMIKRTKTFPGADCGSDHNLLVSYIELKLKKTIKGASMQSQKLDCAKLKDSKVNEQFSNMIEERIKTEGITGIEEFNVEEQWKKLKNIIHETAHKIIGIKENKKKKTWMTEDILELMNERKKYKNIDVIRYKEMDKKIKKEIIKAKEVWLSTKCKEIETLQKTHNTKEIHKKVKEMTGKRMVRTGCIMNKQGKMVTDMEERKIVWAEYVKELYDDQRIDEGKYVDLEGPEIMEEEVSYVINNMKGGKATGTDGIPIEVIKNVGEIGVKEITRLIRNIYNTGKIPAEMNTSITVPIPKLPKTLKCNEHRTLSLLNHISKILLKIIHNRIYKKAEERIGKTQFGFRTGIGTREAIFSLSQITEKAMEMNIPLFLCFIDYEKAFDRIRHDKLIEILKKIGLDSKDIRIIRDAYWNQKTKVKIDNEETEWIEIKRGVRQGCILSPILYNIYSEEIVQEVLDNRKEGIKINGTVINNLRYADDMVLIATKSKDLQKLVEDVEKQSEVMGLSLNVKKTKIMCVNRISIKFNILCKNNSLQQVDSYCYLGKKFFEDNDQTKDIRIRIGHAKDTFNKMKNILCEKKLNLLFRIRILKCYIWPVLLYGCETWTLKKDAIKRIEAFEMWTIRRMLKIKWIDKISNKEVLELSDMERELVNKIQKLKIKYCGHIMRGALYKIPQLTLEGKVEGKRQRGRKRKAWMSDIKEWTRLTTEEIIHKSRDRKSWRLVAANLYRGDGT